MEKDKLFQPDDVLAVFGVGDIGAPLNGRARTLAIRTVFKDIQVRMWSDGLTVFSIQERRGLSSGGKLGQGCMHPPPVPCSMFHCTYCIIIL